MERIQSHSNHIPCPFPPSKDGCQLEDHCVTAEDGTAGDSGVASILLAHQDIICNQDTEEQDTVARCAYESLMGTGVELNEYLS